MVSYSMRLKIQKTKLCKKLMPMKNVTCLPVKRKPVLFAALAV